MDSVVFDLHLAIESQRQVKVKVWVLGSNDGETWVNVITPTEVINTQIPGRLGPYSVGTSHGQRWLRVGLGVVAGNGTEIVFGQVNGTLSIIPPA